MTGPEDSQTSTRPISVAELLAKNGTIGSPPVGGRRRRRRGNSDAVTVAELTGEIPVITDEVIAEKSAETASVTREAPAEPPAAVESVRPARPQNPARPAEPEPVRTNGRPAADVDETGDAEDDYRDHLMAREADPEPIEFKPRRRPQVREYQPTGTSTGAESMSPDFLGADLDEDDVVVDTDDDEPSGGFSGPLFGRDVTDDDENDDESDDDDRHGARSVDTDDFGHDLDFAELNDDADGFADEDDESTGESRGKQIAHGAWIGAQCVLAVAFGAGLFLAFLQLWKWNVIVALVLGVLVILGLAGGVRVVRKTEDIGSTLIAVAVGALVTFGPLALQAALQAG